MQKILFYNKFIICLTCFEHYVLIFRRSKLYYTASGIVTPVGSCPVHRLREDLCTGRPPTGVMISDAVEYRFDLLMMST